VVDTGLTRPETLPGRRTRISGGLVAAIVAVAALVAVAVTTQGFLTASNLKATVASMAFVGIVAVGLTPITLSGSLFSLTLGSTVAMSAVLFFGVLGLGLVPAIAITLVVGILVGAAQGYLVGVLEANPIIVTVAAGLLQGGLASFFTGDSTVYPPTGQNDWTVLSQAPFGIPVSVYALVALVIVLTLALRGTNWGRMIYLIGDNRLAARAAGLPVGRVITIAFAVASACAALAGIFLAAFSANATTQIGGTLSFDSIAAVLVGGTAIAGGSGSALRTVFGAAVIAVISNLLLLRGFDEGVRVAATGALVLVVVIVVQFRSRSAAR
jgi:ribose/xylose/arabinose/galactoside ABC-type transport system permease subunit